MNLANWRRWFRIIHRDAGYLFFGATVVYAASGLALNHRAHWNPSYSISRKEVVGTPLAAEAAFTKQDATNLLAQLNVRSTYLNHYSPTEGEVKVFIEGGSVVLEKATGKMVVEQLERRPLLHTWNRLHYNPGVWWTWFADVYSVALLVLAVTGLLILKGYHGITRRGGVLVAIGILVPLGLVLLYL